MDYPEISIIVPVYNVEKYLPQCLDSILAQTFTDFELICVNDGSTDRSGKILDEYVVKDSRIKVIHQQNKGLVGARNSGIDAAKGKYLYFVDSDDTIHPQLLEICHALAEKENADWVCFQMQKITKNEIPEIKKFDIKKIDYITTESPLIYCTPQKHFQILFGLPMKLYKKSFFNLHKFVLPINFEDYPQTLDFCASHPKTVCLSEALYFYTYNPNSISRSNWTVQKIKDYHSGLNYVYNIYKDRPQELSLVIKNVFGRILKRQLSIIKHSNKDVKKELLKAFVAELADLDAKGCIRLSGSKFKNWLKYKWLIIRSKHKC